MHNKKKYNSLPAPLKKVPVKDDNVSNTNHYYDKVKIVLLLFKIWAILSMQLVKFLTLLLKYLLILPDSVFYIINKLKDIYTTDNEKINILNVYDINGKNITNKFKLLLKIYWKVVNDDSIHDNNGVNFIKLSNLLNTACIFCSYILTNDKNTHQEFYNNIRYLFIERNKNKSWMYKKLDISNKMPLFMDHLYFSDKCDSDSDNDSIFNDMDIKHILT